jgi:succinyl-CoA synthetase alpha subunit
LSYETAKELTRTGLGQSTVIGLGGGPIWGFTYRNALELFEKDCDTDAVVLLGEIGGHIEEEAAEYLRRGYPKRVVAMVVGRTAPPGQKMGHAGAIIEHDKGTAQAKLQALSEAGALIVSSPREIPALLKGETRR